MGAILAQASSADAACRARIDLALERDAADNVTAVVSRCTPFKKWNSLHELGNVTLDHGCPA